MNLLSKILGIKTKVSGDITKKYLFYIPVIRIVEKLTKYKIYFLGIRTICIYKKNEAQKYVQNTNKQSDESLVTYESLTKYTNRKTPAGSVAVLGALPPETTGIALFNALVFGNREGFDFFTYVKSLPNLFYAYSFSGNNNTFTTNIYEKLYLTQKYKTKIFVLGNSYHNVPNLKLAIREKDKMNSWLHIHEANLLSLLFNFFDLDMSKLKYWLKKCYPENYPEISHLTSWNKLDTEAKIRGIYGTRIIRSITGINNFIVNNNVCENLVKLENRDPDVVIKKVFLPIPDLRHVQPRSGLPDDFVYVGSWGIPNGRKLSHVII
ncbi:hypothetical protein II906_03475, partial [bacterium]|nr:hypothetical protein [bacterium]